MVKFVHRSSKWQKDFSHGLNMEIFTQEGNETKGTHKFNKFITQRKNDDSKY